MTAAETGHLVFGPILLFVIGFISLLTYMKRRRQQIEEVPLSEAEQKKAEVLHGEKKR